MRSNLFHSLRKCFQGDRLFWLFALEGALLQYSASINGFGNNIFATNLGASNAQIGLIQTIPNLAAMLVMLPLGFYAGRARSSRTIPMILLMCIAAGYLIMGSVPLLSSLRIPVFFLALPFTVGGATLYGVHWQNLFGDVIPERERYGTLGMRNKFMFLVGIAAPLLCGVLMSRYTDTEMKIRVLQIFYYSCALFTVIQAFVIGRVPAVPRTEDRKSGFSLRDFGITIRELMHNRSFMLFFVPAILFYIAWQMDWSMWYIEEIEYLGMTETQISVYSGVFNIGQLIVIGVLTKLAERKTPDFVLVLALLALAICPPIMAFCMILPAAVKVPVFIPAMTLLTTAQGAVNFCVVLILLRVSPAEKRTMAMSLFTLTTTFTNIFIPYLGIRLYEAFGSDFRAAMIFNLCEFIMRIGVTGLFLWRCRYLKKNGALVDGETT